MSLCGKIHHGGRASTKCAHPSLVKAQVAGSRPHLTELCVSKAGFSPHRCSEVGYKAVNNSKPCLFIDEKPRPEDTFKGYRAEYAQMSL